MKIGFHGCWPSLFYVVLKNDIEKFPMCLDFLGPLFSQLSATEEQQRTKQISLWMWWIFCCGSLQKQTDEIRSE